jgi:hypothetical protein
MEKRLVTERENHHKRLYFSLKQPFVRTANALNFEKAVLKKGTQGSYTIQFRTNVFQCA